MEHRWGVVLYFPLIIRVPNLIEQYDLEPLDLVNVVGSDMAQFVDTG